MKRSMLFALLIAAAGAGGCNKSDVPGHPDHSCPGRGHCEVGEDYPERVCDDVICTADFRDVVVEVRNGLLTVIPVDSIVVLDPGGKPLPPSSGGTPVYGYPNAGPHRFTLINDSWVQGHKNTSLAVRFKGFLNGNEVFDEPYVIAADCCHVSKVSGKDVIDIR